VVLDPLRAYLPQETMVVAVTGNLMAQFVASANEIRAAFGNPPEKKEGRPRIVTLESLQDAIHPNVQATGYVIPGIHREPLP
jgi:hypothetical protein